MMKLLRRISWLNAPLAAPWTNVYGLARSLLAFGLLVTLVLHTPDALFRPVTAVASSGPGSWFAQWSLFELLSGPQLEWARWIAIGILLVTISGWRPRVTGLLHWWVTVSYSTSAAVVNGGDHVATVLALLLIPVTLTDGRRWHWAAPRKAASDAQSDASPSDASTSDAPTLWQEVGGLVAISALLVVRLQVCVIYFHAAVGKLQVQEWLNGTVTYYWFRHPVFGVPAWMESVVHPVIADPVGVLLLTWGAVALEIALAMALFMKVRYRSWLLVAGLGFHLAIAVVHGLFSFFFSMAAALILYLRPYDVPFAFRRVAVRLRQGYRRFVVQARQPSAKRSAPSAAMPAPVPSPASSSAPAPSEAR